MINKSIYVVRERDGFVLLELDPEERADAIDQARSATEGTGDKYVVRDTP